MRCSGCKSQENKIHRNECGHLYCEDCIFTVLSEPKKIYFCLYMTCTKQFDTPKILSLFDEIQKKLKKQEEKQIQQQQQQEEILWEYCSSCQAPGQQLFQNRNCIHKFCDQCTINICQSDNFYYRCPAQDCNQMINRKWLYKQYENQVINQEQFEVKCSECNNLQKAKANEPIWFDCNKCHTRNCASHQQNIKICRCICYRCTYEFKNLKQIKIKVCQLCGYIVCTKCNAEINNQYEFISLIGNKQEHNCNQQKEINEKNKQEEKVEVKMETIDQKEYTLKDKKTCEMCFEYFSVYNPRSSSKTKFICMMCNLTDKQLSTKKLELKDEKDYNESTHKYLSLNEGLMPSQTKKSKKLCYNSRIANYASSLLQMMNQKFNKVGEQADESENQNETEIVNEILF